MEIRKFFKNKTKANRRLPRGWSGAVTKLSLSIAILPVVTGWVGDYLKDILLNGPWRLTDKDLALFVFSLLVMLLAIRYTLKEASALFLHAKQIRRAEKVQPANVWIGAVSFSKNWRWRDGTLILNGKNDSENSIFFEPGAIDEALNTMSSLNPPFPWEQILRGIRPHLPDLRKIVLLASPQNENQLDECSDLLRYMYKLEGVTILKHAGSFEKLEELLPVYEDLIEDSQKDSRVVLDITGGKKVISVAAAMASLRYPDVEFQYVDTEGQKEVSSFNVVTITSG